MMMAKFVSVLRDKKNKYSNSCAVRNFFSERNKNHNPPPFKLNGRSLICYLDDYPKSPPIFHYISFCTDRLNPNLYDDGKVCVSLLGTWEGKVNNQN
jgi:hypothetical protein